MLVLGEGRTGVSQRKTSQRIVENQHQAQPTNGVEPRIKPRPHCRKVSGLTSAPTGLISWHFTEIILKQPNKSTKLNRLRIPTCRRQISWLCTSEHRLGVEPRVKHMDEKKKLSCCPFPLCILPSQTHSTFKIVLQYLVKHSQL